MSVPRFGGGGVKCKTCAKTVYASEQMVYDGQTFHQECFKCLECKRTMQLTAVAMIGGDLYCKNCFKRIFQREGKYTSFADKAGERARSSTTIDAPAGTAPAPAPVSNSASSNAVAPPAASPTERRGSVVLPCVVADCKQPRVSRKSYCLEHLNNNSSTPSGVSRGSGAAAEAMPSNVSDLFDAIASKNVDRVKDLLSGEQSAGLLFRTNARGMTPIEAAFTGIANSRACGEAMLAWLQNKVSALEQQQAAGAQ